MKAFDDCRQGVGAGCLALDGSHQGADDFYEGLHGEREAPHDFCAPTDDWRQRADAGRQGFDGECEGLDDFCQGLDGFHEAAEAGHPLVSRAAALLNCAAS